METTFPPERLEGILSMAARDVWSGAFPRVSASLRIAINSLNDQIPKFWEKEATVVVDMLEKENSWVLNILEDQSDEAIAFAIRDARK